MFTDKLLDILACPVCKGGLLKSVAGNGLLCAPCGLEYPVKDGIPVMLPDEAIKIQAQSSGYTAN